jgi:hypothetical protein
MNTQRSQLNIPSPFWWQWLTGATVVVLAFGLAMVLAPELISRLFAAILSSSHIIESLEEPAKTYHLLFQGVLGGTMFGWGTALLVVLLTVFRRGMQEGWIILSISLIAWFIPDTAFSIWSGYWQNGILNAIFLALFAIPLAATYRTFFPKQS